MPLYRFGEFDFHPESGELRRRGVPVKLQAQPAQVLALLVAAKGELVTRESLRASIWNDGTTVEFDRSINFCIAQIRSALGDSAESSLYIRTIPRRGYQFVAPTAEPAPAPNRRAILIVPCVAIAAAALWVTRRRESRIAVTRFDNETGNPAVDRLADTLTDLLIAELTAGLAPTHAIIGNAAGLRAPRQERNIAVLANTLQAQYVILGQIQNNGPALRALAHLIRMPEQTHLRVTRLDIQESSTVAAAQRIVREFAEKLNK